MADPIPLQDLMSAARAGGYEWGQINTEVAEGTQRVADAGYTPDQIRSFYGYKDPGVLVSRLQSNLPSDPLGVKQQTNYQGPDQPETTVKLSPEVAQQYATGMVNGEVAQPAGFMRALMAAHYPDMSPLDQEQHAVQMMQHLPTFQQATDAALGVLALNGQELDPEATRDARENLLHLWAQTGQPPFYGLQSDPITQDAIATPGSYVPTPTLGGLSPEDLQKQAEKLPGDIADYFKGVAEHLKKLVAPLDTSVTPENWKAEILSPERLQTAEAIGLGTTPATLESKGPEAVESIFRQLEGNASGHADYARSPAGALGRFQIMPATGAEYGFGDAERLRNDVEYNTAAFHAIVNDLQKKYGNDLEAISVAYNAGPGVADRWLAAGRTMATKAEGGVLPNETIRYVEHARRIAAGQGIEVATAIQNAANTPIIQPTEFKLPGIKGKPELGPLEDNMYRLRANAQADKIELMQSVDKWPAEWKTPEFQEKVANEVEARLANPQAKFSPDTEAFLNKIQSLTDEQRELAAKIRETKGGKDFETELQNLATPGEGYMHRVTLGYPNRMIPPGMIPETDVVAGGTGIRKSLVNASAIQKRHDFYVFEDSAGNRQWGERPLDEAGLKFGQKIGDYTVKRATMQEIEANTNIKYFKNFAANTIENIARLREVYRNLQFFETVRTELEARGLFSTEERQPAGMIRVDLPSLHGWMEAHYANALNDIFVNHQGDLMSSLSKISRFLMQSLFISPVTHIGNVGAHYAVGRGFDWVNPIGYGRLMKSSIRAIQQVWTLGPDYISHLRDGSGLQYASVETQNFYNVVMTKLFHEQMADKATWGSYARSLGFKGISDLVRWEYKFSQKALWSVNDMFLLARQFELEAKGTSRLEAIAQSEKDIPNYRIPTYVMGSHSLGEFMRSNVFMAFGRYRYGQLRALAVMARDLAGRGRTGAERMEALGKFTILGAMMFGVYPLLNYSLEKVTQNKKASVRYFGPFSILNAIHGLFTPQQMSYANAVGSIVTMSPILDAGYRALRNQDYYGRPIINPHASPLGLAVQAGEAGLQTFYPGQLFMQAARGNMEGAVGNLLGLKIPKPNSRDAFYQHRDIRAAHHREQRDPIESWIKQRLP